MTKSIQSVLTDAVKKELSPAKLLATFIIESAKDQGLGELTPDRARIETAIEEWMSKAAPCSDSLWFSVDADSPDTSSRQISLDAAEFEQYIRKCLNSLDIVIPEVTKDVAVAMLRTIKQSAKEGQLLVRKFEEDSFRERLLHYWDKAFDLLILEIELARECGEWCAKRLLTKRRKRAAPLIETTFLLHARACRVGGEVLALLEAGYADGAYARWRTLHEIAVTTDFLLNHGDWAAQLYLDHVDIDSWRTAAHLRDAGDRRIAKRTLDRLDRRAARLSAKHGKSFCTGYGWAAVVLKKNSVTFADIERAVGLEKSRPIFKLASNMVHAGPKGALYKIGLLDGWEPRLLAGPSNSGLDVAGGYAGLSLMHVTANLLHLRVSADTLVWIQVMIALAQDVEHAFAQAQRRIMKDERTTGGSRSTRRKTKLNSSV